MELEEMKSTLEGWMSNSFGYRGYTSEECMDVNIDTGVISIKLFTSINEYSIRARFPKDTSEGYLGAIASSRMPRAGETWTRGGDLPDGIFSKDTWDNIVGSIVGYELVKIHRKISVIDD